MATKKTGVTPKKTTKAASAKKKPVAAKSVASKKASATTPAPKNEGRRDFMVLAASSTVAVGAATSIVPLIGSMAPADDVLALSSTEVDLSSVEKGQSVTVMWRGKPVFIRNRTDAEVKAARTVTNADLPDAEDDSARVKKGKDNWLVVVGICTHLGCVPLGNKGDYDGWFCPCHGSHYDTSGRIRKGPAPTNLTIPPYTFVNNTTIKIG